MEILKILSLISGFIKSLIYFYDLLGHEKVLEKSFPYIRDEIIIQVEKFLTQFLVIPSKFSEVDRDALTNMVKVLIKCKEGFVVFSRRKIEKALLNEFVKDKECHIDVFLKFVYFYQNGRPKIIQLQLYIHRIKSYFCKYTIYHYLSIPRWSECGDYKLLKDKVKSIKSIDERFLDLYTVDIKPEFSESKPVFSKVIKKIISEGKIAETTIRNLSSAQKILMVHKYSEGLSNIFKEDRKRIDDLKIIIAKNEESDDKTAQKKVEKAYKEIERIQAKGIRTPVAVALERCGFIKLFRNMNGVYVIPLWKIPFEYQNQPHSFIQDIVLIEAEKVVKELSKKDERISAFSGNLKYVILAHVINFNQIKVLEKERELSISSPALSQSMLLSFLSYGDPSVSSIYINDIVGNVDFLSFVKKDSKTGTYIVANYDKLQSILIKYNVDLNMPMTLTRLHKNQVSDIAIDLIGRSRQVRKQDIIRFINNQIKFYTDLNMELIAMKSN